MLNIITALLLIGEITRISPVIFIWHTRCTYSFLFSSVTRMLAPFGLRSLTSHTPNSWTYTDRAHEGLSVALISQCFNFIFYSESQMEAINSILKKALKIKVTLLQHLFHEDINHLGFKPSRPNTNFNS